MSGGVIDAMKFAVTGVVAGVGVAFVTDQINARVLQPVIMPGSATPLSPLGVAGRVGFQVVATGCLAAAVIYAGDKMLDVIGSDPLFRIFYYNIALNSSATVNQSVRGTIQLLNMATYTISNVGQSVPPPAQAGSASSAAPSCATGGCGGGAN